MKIAALQPPYPYRPADMPALVEWLTTRLDECDASLDLIVLPEACDAMSSYPDYAAFEADVEAYCQPLLDKARATAIRCGALVAINLYKGPKGHYRNVTVLFDAAGNVAGEYFKQHLPQAEREGKRLDERTPARITRRIRSIWTACATRFSPATTTITMNTSSISR